MNSPSLWHRDTTGKVDLRTPVHAQQRLLYCSKKYLLTEFKASQTDLLVSIQSFCGFYETTYRLGDLCHSQPLLASLAFFLAFVSLFGTCMMATLCRNHGSPMPLTGILCSPAGSEWSLTLSPVVTSVFMCVVLYLTTTNSLQPAAHSGLLIQSAEA